MCAHGAGRRYLIQHSAGSGKSNSIAWLAHQLIGVKRSDRVKGSGQPVFDSVIVVTDRRMLDDQIQKTIKQFMQVGATVGHAEHSGDLRRFIEQGKKIIVTTVQKFPFMLDEIGAARPGQALRHRHRRGAFEPGRQDLGGDEALGGGGGTRCRRSSRRCEERDDPKTW
jgi:type I restriction enzyme R subunit